MSIILNINGTDYEFPEEGDENWGPDVTDWAQAVTTGMLQKAGGEFLLQAEVDFGGAFGLKSVYYKSRSENVASDGQIRLARADSIQFRNEANTGNLLLTVDSDNDLTFNGSKLGIATEITNADIATNAAIAVSKLNGIGVNDHVLTIEANVPTWKVNITSDNSVSTAKLQDLSVTSDKLANSAVTESKIASNAIVESKISDNAVTTNKINNNAVTTAKIPNDAITTDKILNSNITTDKINNSAVTSDKLASSSVTTAKINDGAVTNAKIGVSEITRSKITTDTFGITHVSASSNIDITDPIMSQDGYVVFVSANLTITVPLNVFSEARLLYVINVSGSARTIGVSNGVHTLNLGSMANNTMRMVIIRQSAPPIGLPSQAVTEGA